MLLNHSQGNRRGGYIAFLLASGPGAVHTMGMPSIQQSLILISLHTKCFEEVETEEDKFERAEMVSFYTNCFSRERDLSQQNRRRSH